MGDVLVRLGKHRYAYHADPNCPALNGKPETFEGIQSMPEDKAKELDLKACQQCKP